MQGLASGIAPKKQVYISSFKCARRKGGMRKFAVIEYLVHLPVKNAVFNPCRARNNVLNVPDHADRQSRLFADQIKILPIRSICPQFHEKILNMPLNTHLNRKFNFISNSSLNL